MSKKAREEGVLIKNRKTENVNSADVFMVESFVYFMTSEWTCSFQKETGI